MIKDYNDNGAYFKSTFGLNQYRYDSFSNLTLDEKGNIWCTVETIVGFDNKDDFQLERRVKELEQLDKYLPQEEDRITEKDFNSLKEYLNEIFPKFWGLIDKTKFK